MGDWKRTSLASKMVKQLTKSASHDSASPNVHLETLLFHTMQFIALLFAGGSVDIAVVVAVGHGTIRSSLNSTILDSRQHRPESPSNSQEYPTLLANKI